MKLLLTSEGFRVNSSLFDQMVSLVLKPANQIKIGLFSVKITDLDELFVTKDLDLLKDLGISADNIKVININKEIPQGIIDDLDVVYICGGNTYLILDCLRRNGYVQPILDFINKDGVYVGHSAGSMLVGPNIDLCNFEDNHKNNIGLEDTSGWNLVDFSIFPHYPYYIDGFQDEFEEFKKNYKYRFVTLQDDEAIVVDGNQMRFIY